MENSYGQDAFFLTSLIAHQQNRNYLSYLALEAKLIILWDGATIAVFRNGNLLGEHPTDCVQKPTAGEFDFAMQQLASHYPLPHTK
jgi:hypothetical protein